MKRIGIIGMSGIGKTTISIHMFHALKKIGKRVAYLSAGETEEQFLNIEYYDPLKEYDYQIVDINMHYPTDDINLLENIDINILLIDSTYNLNIELIKSLKETSWFNPRKSYLLFNLISTSEKIQIDKNMYPIPVIPVIIRNRPGFKNYINSENGIFDSITGEMAKSEINILSSFVDMYLDKYSNEAISLENSGGMGKGSEKSFMDELKKKYPDINITDLGNV